MIEIPVRNPRNGQIDYHVEDIEAAVIAERAEQLRDAQSDWQARGIDYRCEQLAKWKARLENDGGAISAALCKDTGRRAFAEIELQGVIGLMDYWLATAPGLLQGEAAQPSALVPTVEYQHRALPYPLVGVISPWNVPLILALIDAIPALLAGSAVLLKPSEVTPRFAAPLAKSLEGIEGLEGVINIVTGGPQAGMAVIDAVDAICFTGSVATGRKVGVQAAQNFIPAFLELGGKDPAIVMPSADLDNAATAIVRSAIGLTGQTCQSLERVFVHREVYDAFREKVVATASAVQINWPDISQGQIGPLIFAGQAATISEQLEDAYTQGARALCGGTIEEHDGGFWCLPTVLDKVSMNMRIMREETFGPIIPLLPFDSEAEAIELANDSEFGLSGAVFAGDAAEAERIAAQLQVGAVSINDASLTALVNDVEKNSFCLSGLGGSRMGPSGLTRFLRKRALLRQTVPAAPIQIFSEG